MLTIVAAAVAAAVLGAAGPFVLARLPEPMEPQEGKRLYQDLAKTAWLGPSLALAAALLAAGVAARVEPSSLVAVWVVLSGVGVLLAFIDWHTKLLPFLIVAPFNALVLVLVAVAAAVERDWSVLSGALVAAAIVYGLLWVSNFLVPSAIGFGDVRLSFALALALGALGPGSVVFGLWCGFALGAICSIVLKGLKVIDGRDFAFGPYLILGAMAGAIWGPSFSTAIL